MYFLGVLVQLSMFLPSARGAHFRGGSISWTAVSPTLTNSSQIPIEIDQTYSWSYNRYNCGALIGDINNVTCISTNCSNYNSALVSTQTPCSSFDVNFDVSTGSSSTVITLDVGAQLVLAYRSMAWSTLASGGTGSWSIATSIDLRVRTDNGRINSAPTATMNGIITAPMSIPYALRIPMEDKDLDFVRCRWANATAMIYSTVVDECASICQNIPGAQLYSSLSAANNCTLVFTGVIPGYYIVALQIEDFMPSALTDPPLSSVSLQFPVLVLNISCDIPRIISQLPNRATIGVEVNQIFTMTLFAQPGCNNTFINYFFTIIQPSDAVNISTVTYLGSMLYSVDFTWTPSSTLIDTKQSFCTIAVDSNKLQSAQYCLNFIVNGNITIISTTTTTTTTTITIATTATTTATTTTTSEPIVTTVQTANDFPLILGLALSLALLLVLTSVLLFGCCYWYPGLFWRRAQQSDHRHEHRSNTTSDIAIELKKTVSNRFQPIYTTKIPKKSIQSSADDYSGDYRRQYIQPEIVPPLY